MKGPEGAVLVLIDPNGRIALQLRDDIPDTWGLFGGWLEPGEAPEAGAQRELEEELGLRLPLDRFHLIGTHTEPGRFFAYVYRIHITHELDNAVLGVGLDWGFFPPEAIATMKVMPHDPEMLRLFGFLC
jgi:8-oxo-dGTP pyrophosphatase MutT (NUDIX family)